LLCNELMIITIGGAPGSGKSTVGRMLATNLNVPFFGMGEVRRQYALAHGMSLEELNEQAKTDPTSDHMVDNYAAELGKTLPSFVLDGRVGFHVIPHSIKIYVKVEVRVAAERIFSQRRESEHWETVEDGIESLQKREVGDRQRYMQLYRVDPTDPSHYDLVIDSTGKNPVELLEEVLAFLREKRHLRHEN
jgi:CMP/dCMP kinase